MRAINHFRDLYAIINYNIFRVPRKDSYCETKYVIRVISTCLKIEEKNFPVEFFPCYKEICDLSEGNSFFLNI